MLHLLKIAVFGLTLLIGIAVASLPLSSASSAFTEFTALPTQINSVEGEDRNATAPSGIRVAYSGWERSSNNGEPYLKFIVYNGLYTPISYGSHSAESPFPKVKVNGKEVQQSLRCGTGIKNFYILPGTTAEFHVRPYEFLDAVSKTDRVQTGFYLRPAFAEKSEQYMSEPFLLPDEFREALNAEARTK